MTAPAKDTPARGRIRVVRAELIGLAGNRVAVADLLVDDTLPICLAYCGDLFLREISAREDGLVYVYRETRPYRIDGGVTDEVAR